MVQSFVSSHTTELYDPRAFFTHAALLHQGSPHCAISPTAASRRSLDRVSVPMWPFTLSGRLLIVALVGSYPTNQLIRRKLVCDRFRFAVYISQFKQFISYQLTFLSVIRVSQVDYLRVTHPSATKLYIFHPKTSYIYFVRLACVRHAASVHPEPGSNSQLKFILQLFTDFCVVIPYLPYSGSSCLLSDFHCPFIIQLPFSAFVNLAWYSLFIILFLFFFVKHFLTKYFIFLLSFLCFFKSIEIFCFYLVSLTARI